MPTYEYRCRACKKDFEVFQKITDDPVAQCPHCGGGVERLINATNFILKGTGWYKTDYSSPPSSPPGDLPACGSKKDKASCQTCPAAKSD